SGAQIDSGVLPDKIGRGRRRLASPGGTRKTFPAFLPDRMKRLLLLGALLSLAACVTPPAPVAPSPLTLWYPQPAAQWTEALPLVSYEVNGVHFTREVFTSLAENVLVIHLTASQPGALGFTAGWATPQKCHSVRRDCETLVLSGTTPDWEGVPGQDKFEAQ